MIARLVQSLRRLFGGPASPTQDRAPIEQPAPAPPAARDTEPEITPAAPKVEAEEHEPVASAEVDHEDAIGVATAESEPSVEPAAATVSVPERAADAGLVLRLESARGEPVKFEVAAAGATLGRAAENAIRLDDLSVSRRHARIAYRERAYWLSDVGSVGGTWVDGTRLNAPRRLAEGQVIDIGTCRLTVLSAGPPVTAAARGRARA
jgi:FHA domain-containing protein